MSVIDILYTIFDASVRSSVRHAPESSVSLMNLISNKPFFILSTPPLILGKFAKLGRACERVTLLAFRFNKYHFGWHVGG